MALHSPTWVDFAQDGEYLALDVQRVLRIRSVGDGRAKTVLERRQPALEILVDGAIGEIRQRLEEAGWTEE